MRLLIDNALSPHLASFLRAAGEDAIHIRERIPPDSADEVVFDLAVDERRIFISADSDYPPCPSQGQQTVSDPLAPRCTGAP